MKRCPRCRNMMKESLSNKLICRSCGHTVINLEVVSETQDFQGSFNFTKKAAQKPDSDS